MNKIKILRFTNDNNSILGLYYTLLRFYVSLLLQ